MTITTFEEHNDDDAAQQQSEPSSPVIGVSVGGQKDLTCPTDVFHEIKFEMRASKGASSSSSVHDRLKDGLPTKLTSVTPSKLSNAQAIVPNVDRSTLSAKLPGWKTVQSPSPSSSSSSSRSTLTDHLSNRPYDKDSTKISRSLSGTARSVPTDIEANLATSPSLPSIRTRLRRQRRMASQDSSVDQAEDPMERLNRLRARISGALSEVKGVLNKYSTEIEPNEAVTQQDPKLNSQPTQQTEQTEQQCEEDSGPVLFRFVRKVRRRSVFNENDDGPDAGKGNDNLEQNAIEEDTSKSTGEQRNALKVTEIGTKLKENVNLNAQEPVPIIKIAAATTSPTKEIQKKSLIDEKDSKSSSANFKPNKILTVPSTTDKRRVSIGTVQEVDSKKVSDIKTQRRPSDSTTIVGKKATEQLLKKEGLKKVKTLTNGKVDLKEDIQNSKISEKETGNTIKIKSTDKGKEPLADKKSSDESRPGKSLTIKRNDSLRRSSIAAVERSKIEPPVKGNISPNVKTQRRPSDSEAIIKKSQIQSTALKGESPTKRPLEKKRTEPSMREEGLKKVINATNEKVDLKENVQNSKMTEKEIENSIKIKSTDKGKEPLAEPTTGTVSPKESSKLIGDKKSCDETRPGKRLSVKRNDSLRRSSIAAVERSKIEPPVKGNISPNVKAQRRPSDSEAIIKKSQVQSTAITDQPTNQIKRSLLQKNADKSAKTSHVTSPRVDNKNTKTVTTESKNSCKGDLIDKKKCAMMPIHSGTVIDNEISTPSSAPSLSSTQLATTIATIATTATSAIQKTEIPDKTKNSDSPVISDNHKSANVAVPPPNLSQQIEASSEQFNSAPTYQNRTPNTESLPLLEKPIIPPSTDNTANKRIDPRPTNAITNNDAIKTDCSQPDDIKKPIPVTVEQPLPPLPSASPSSTAHQLSSSPQQVAASSAELGVIATHDGICMHKKNTVPEIVSTTAEKSLSEVNVIEATTSSPSRSQIYIIARNDVATKAATAAVESITPIKTAHESESLSVSVSVSESVLDLESEKKSEEKNMPELQVPSPPVKAVTVHPDSETSIPFGEAKEVFPKKRAFFKKIIRKSSSDRPQKLATNNVSNRDQKESNEDIADSTPTTAAVEVEVEATQSSESPLEEEQQQEQEQEPEHQPETLNRTRKIKKKVIIKRLQRRLSGSEQTFFIGTNDEKPISDVETLEKVIAYVTDDEDEEDETVQSNGPLKSCMRLREYQVGDLVLYAERYKKTQLRWKKGRIIERITSISYMVDIDGKEVSAHINYLKKYTGRKVRFGEKEYLEIDYEQIAEEEPSPRTYSIWNLV